MPLAARGAMDDSEATEIWAFESVVDAAVFTTLYYDDPDEEFEEHVWQVYSVIERRVREGPDTGLIGVPENKEQAVKSTARELEDGFDEATRLAQAKEHYENVPVTSSSSLSVDEPYWGKDDFDPYN